MTPEGNMFLILSISTSKWNRTKRRGAGLGHLQPTPPGPPALGTLWERTIGAAGAPGGGQGEQAVGDPETHELK